MMEAFCGNHSHKNNEYLAYYVGKDCEFICREVEKL